MKSQSCMHEEKQAVCRAEVDDWTNGASICMRRICSEEVTQVSCLSCGNTFPMQDSYVAQKLDQ